MRKISFFLWRIIAEIPIIGPVLIIKHYWLSDGDNDFLDKCFSFRKVILKNLAFFIFSLPSGYAYIFFVIRDRDVSVEFKNLLSVGLQVYPTLFSIGLAIFLLIFSINIDLNKSRRSFLIKRKGVGYIKRMLVAELAYPLVLMASIVAFLMFFSLFFNALNCNAKIISSFLIFTLYAYSFCIVFNMILAIFLMAKNLNDK